MANEIDEFQGAWSNPADDIVQETLGRLRDSGVNVSAFGNANSGAASPAPYDHEAGGDNNTDWFILGVDELGDPTRELHGVDGLVLYYGR